MVEGRLWAIPDIHGRFDLLTKLWALLTHQLKVDLTKDKVVYLGDMVDRGLEVASVLRFIKLQKEMFPNNVVVLRGNHEQFLLDAFEEGATDEDWQIWFYDGNGGKQTYASLMALPAPVRKELVEWIDKLPLYHEEDGFFFSHAPAPRDNRRKLTNLGHPFTAEELLWGYHRDEPGYAREFGDRIGVCGHIHKLQDGIKDPRFYDHYIFADAGCGCHPKAPLVAIDVKLRAVVRAEP